jgi:hypothetical protein
MENHKTFESFPLWMVAMADAVAFGIYIIGAYIMFKLGAAFGWLYLLLCLIVEIRVMRISCIYCYYYGKLCGLGRGKLASLFFGKGDPKKFLEKKITWKGLIPDLLVSFIPFVLGIYILFKHFNWFLLILILFLLLLTTFGNGFVRSNFACKYCKQRGLGCPAEKLFANAKNGPFN